MTERRSFNDTAAIIIICTLLVIVVLVIGGVFVARTFVARAQAIAELQRAEATQRQVELALKNYEQAATSQSPPGESTGPDAATAEPLRLVSWNVESDGNDPAVIAQQLVELGSYDIFALQEVHPDNVGRYGDAIREGLGKSYRFFASHTGRSDRLMIAFDSDLLELAEFRELFSHDGHQLNDWRHRSPLVALFRDQQSGVEFLFVTLHLARGNAKLRTEQACGLREWARDQQLPIVAIGDFTMDYDFASGEGNDAFVECQREQVWKWIRPAELIDTNWSDRDGDGVDDYPDSMLDFAFVAGGAKEWDCTCRVTVRPGDFPDDDRTADHRPVELTIEFGSSSLERTVKGLLRPTGSIEPF